MTRPHKLLGVLLVMLLSLSLGCYAQTGGVSAQRSIQRFASKDWAKKPVTSPRHIHRDFVHRSFHVLSNVTKQPISGANEMTSPPTAAPMEAVTSAPTLTTNE